VENVTKVISVTELRKNYKQYKDRRALLKEYDHFVCDKRVSALMPSLLGKKFLAKKRQPIAIEINQGQDFSAELKAARDSTAVFVPQSKLTVVRVGTTGFEAKELAANLQAVITFLSTHKQNGGAANIQGLFIKTKNTLALPLYQALPDNEGEIDSSDSEDADIDTEMKELLGKAVSEMTEQEQEQALNTLLKQTEDPNLVAAPSKKDIRKRAQKRKEADTEAAKKTVVKKRRAN
jgi:ribosome biogenesis protein UTP30